MSASVKKRPIIAVDIDDVLAAEAPFVIAYSNEHWGYNFTLDDYQEFWGAMWNVSGEESARRAAELHAPGVEGSYQPITRAREALEHLRERFDLVVVTSRRESVHQETLDWLDRYIGTGVFSQVVFSGIWDSGKVGAEKMTKTDILRSIGARYLIDDQPKHCYSAAAGSIRAILFGEYPWNSGAGAPALPPGVVRCRDWQAVQGYFDGIS
ncbi:MAG TPA: hypothetical protein VF261_01700 [Candidatus Saccharimonadales bacterium]